MSSHFYNSTESGKTSLIAYFPSHSFFSKSQDPKTGQVSYHILIAQTHRKMKSTSRYARRWPKEVL